MNVQKRRSGSDTHRPLELIRSFVAKQQALICEAIKMLNDDVTDITLRTQLPRSVWLNDTCWNVLPHGIGATFQNEQSGEIINVHVGMLDAPEAFDAWRLEEFEDSLDVDVSDGQSWEDILNVLEKEGHLCRYNEYPKHFFFKNIVC